LIAFLDLLDNMIQLLMQEQTENSLKFVTPARVSDYRPTLKINCIGNAKGLKKPLNVLLCFPSGKAAAIRDRRKCAEMLCAWIWGARPTLPLAKLE
jgi:hypothetical protein